MESATMGRVLTEATIESLFDLWDNKRGLIPADRIRRVTVPDALVDTGASFSWISRTRLERLGIVPSRTIPFRAIDGRLLERDIAIAYVASNGYTAPDVVVMAEEGEVEVMGAHSIEGLGLAADPVQKRLVPTVLLALSIC